MRSNLIIAVFAVYMCSTLVGYSEPLHRKATMRAGPGPNWTAIGEIPAGGELEIMNCGPGWGRDWCHVRWENAEGYIPATSLGPSLNQAIKPVVTADVVTLRKGPGSRFKQIGTIPSGTNVGSSYCAKGWQSGWCPVYFKGETGFVKADSLLRQPILTR